MSTPVRQLASGPAVAASARSVLVGRIVSPATGPKNATTRARSVWSRTWATVRFVVRQLHHVLAGVQAIAARAWAGLTLADLATAARAAHAAGDSAAAASLHAQRAAALAARWERLRQAPRVAAGLVVLTVAGLAGLSVVVLLLVALAAAGGHGDTVATLAGIGDALSAVAAGVLAVAPWVVAVVPVAALIGLWHTGRATTPAPSWLVTSTRATAGAAIDENTITGALVALRVPAITAAKKAGAPLQFLVPARRDGAGTHAVVRLPAGVAAEKIVPRRADLASGLGRSAREVWPTVGDEAGLLDLWVADKGALDAGAGPCPTLTDTDRVDVFEGLPFGRTLRGIEVRVPIMGRNTLIGGMPGQGKSSGARVLLAAAALDPNVEIRVYVPDLNYDFEAFGPRCSRYLMGSDSATLAAIKTDLAALPAECDRRGQLLVDHKAQEVTPELARAGVGLHPLIILIEEAQGVLTDPELADVLTDVVKVCRKRGIHLVFSTQAPTADSMPRGITRNATNGIAYAVGDHVANDALLGAGAYRAGIRATELLPGTDAGTCIIRGVTKGAERAVTVQTYRLRAEDIPDIIRAALERIHAAGHPVPGTDNPGRTTPAPVLTRDLLADVLAALDGHEHRAARVPALLAALAPDWPPYQSMTGKDWSVTAFVDWF